jgi:N-acetylglucosamine-6-phosphate deacetylase
MSQRALSGKVLLPNGQIEEATVIIQDGAIAQVIPGAQPGADVAVDGTIIPGFIDLQVNGAYGVDFTADGRSVAQVAARLPETGVTAFLPTVVTAPWERYPRLLEEIRVGCAEAVGAQPLGVHLEGPFLSPRRPGAHNPAWLRQIDLDELLAWAAPDIVRVVTLAPELPGALEAITRLRQQGILVSAGHSDATFAEAMAGLEAGIGWGTHLFNAMSSLGHREPGLPGALLTTAVPCGLIADEVHLHPAMIRLAYRVKGAAGLTLITDAMAAMGMAPGRYLLGGQEVFVDRTSARLANGRLAGSILTMDQAVRNMVAITGCSLAEAVAMASTTPAAVLNLTRKGRIAPGCDADLVVLDGALRVQQTWVAGRLVYEA